MNGPRPHGTRGGIARCARAEEREPAPEMWQRYSADVAQLREQLRAVPIEDRATWAHVARDTAGAFAACPSAWRPRPGRSPKHLARLPGQRSSERAKPSRDPLNFAPSPEPPCSRRR